jgi:uncharacterized protein YrrD
MQCNVNSLIGNSVDAIDGDIGRVEDVYFDDSTWVVRYLIIKTGHWLSCRKVLMSTHALVKNICGSGIFQVSLTKAQVHTSPDIDTDQPVYRQQEIELHRHYAWQNYWELGYYTGGLLPSVDTQDTAKEKLNKPDNNGKQSRYNQRLRSSNKIAGYTIHATDGDIGHISDFIIDNETWEIVYFVVDTHHWFGGKEVLVPVKHITEVQWEDSTVYVNISMDAIKESTAFKKTRVGHSESGRALL